ncbi:hypothetical protein [Geobacter sp. AOG2]|uniref:hypothetical protein n=1 Tax=Geobacter sp. AOG2 TaxID=1566347 RepID=UPI001CC3C67E|nr:hypothetical protein [Geobacter sp. AOG2]GFE60547.1 hypothetical protein AOG2_11350 [Geobacter sp. AOG2]
MNYCKYTLFLMTFLVSAVSLNAAAEAATYNLRADTATIAMADGTTVTVWGFADDTTVGAGNGAVTVPGPKLTAAPGEAVTINVTNRLPVPVSLVFPGQPLAITPNALNTATSPNYDAAKPSGNVSVNPYFGFTPGPFPNKLRVRSFTTEAAANGGTASYSFTAKEGTYLYESGTNPAIQIPLGLYGALIVGPAGDSGTAYSGSAATTFNHQEVLLFSTILARYDFANKRFVTLNEDVAAAPTTSRTLLDYRALYYLINGKSFPETIKPGPYAPYGTNGKTLLRLINAGNDSVVPAIQGNYMDSADPAVAKGHAVYPSVIAEDGNLLTYPRNEIAPNLTAGKTLDVMIDLTKAATPGYYSIYDRRLGLTNAGKFPGGMLTFLASWDQATQNCSPLKGSANNDGNVTLIDVVKALRIVVAGGYDASYDVTPLSTSGLPCGDGALTVADALILLKKAIGLNPY